MAVNGNNGVSKPWLLGLAVVAMVILASVYLWVPKVEGPTTSPYVITSDLLVENRVAGFDGPALHVADDLAILSTTCNNSDKDIIGQTTKTAVEVGRSPRVSVSIPSTAFVRVPGCKEVKVITPAPLHLTPGLWELRYSIHIQGFSENVQATTEQFQVVP